MLSRLLLLFVLCIVIPFQAISQQQESKRANRLLNNIPIREMLDETPKDLHNQFSENPFKISDSRNKEMLEMFLQSYKAEALLKDVRKTFRAKYDAAYADTVQRWMRTEKPQQILDLHGEYYTLEGKRKRVISKYKFDQNPPSDDRKKIINDLLDHKKSVKHTIEQNVILFKSLLRAIDTVSSNRSIGPSRMQGIVGNYKSQLQQNMAQQLTNKLLVMYRTADDDMISEYSHFYTTPSGQWFSQAVSTAIKKAYKKAGDRFLESVKSM